MQRIDMQQVRGSPNGGPNRFIFYLSYYKHKNYDRMISKHMCLNCI